MTARLGRTRRYSLKEEQELPNVYVSTEPGAVHQAAGRYMERPCLAASSRDDRPLAVRIDDSVPIRL
jgi:hypothetical protein